MYDFYPMLDGVKYFDLQKKHLLYGRVDRQGDAISLDHMNLKEIYGDRKNTHFAVDFVADAFRDLRLNIQKVGNAIDKKSLYRPNMQVHKAWNHGDLEYKYNNYINNIYSDFVNSYLSLDRRHEKIKDFKTFVREFLLYVLRVAKSFPITKTGYILSNHCSPFISGLMFEVSPQQHGTQNNANVIKFIKDPNYNFIVNETRKFGFMLDINAPWRFVFNIFSGAESNDAAGGQKYLTKYGVSHENILNFYYRKTHLDERVNTENLFYSLYDAFYTQFNTYETQKFVTDNSGRCNRVKIVSERKDREPPEAIMSNAAENDEYWLKVVLKLRMAESDKSHTPQNFNFYVTKMLSENRMFSQEAALNYINNLTKGFKETKFISKGSYWFGGSEQEYLERKREAKKRRLSADRVQYQITGTKNIVK